MEGELEEAVDAVPGDHALLDDEFLVGALVDAATHLGVLALAVLADDVEVDVAGLVAAHRRRDAGQEAHRAQIDVLPKLAADRDQQARSEEHTSELQSLMRISYAVFCLKTNNNT